MYHHEQHNNHSLNPNPSSQETPSRRQSDPVNLNEAFSAIVSPENVLGWSVPNSNHVSTPVSPDYPSLRAPWTSTAAKLPPVPAPAPVTSTVGSQAHYSPIRETYHRSHTSAMYSPNPSPYKRTARENHNVAIRSTAVPENNEYFPASLPHPTHPAPLAMTSPQRSSYPGTRHDYLASSQTGAMMKEEVGDFDEFDLFNGALLELEPDLSPTINQPSDDTDERTTEYQNYQTSYGS